VEEDDNASENDGEIVKTIIKPGRPPKGAKGSKKHLRMCNLKKRDESFMPFLESERFGQ